jgi:DNA-binding CsgD family transcriptional regulator
VEVGYQDPGYQPIIRWGEFRVTSQGWRFIVGYGALGGACLACLWIVGLSPLAFDWGRELVAGALTLVAVVVGMKLSAGSPRPPEPVTLPAPAPAPEPAPSPAPDPGVGLLSPRELQILRLLDRGLTNKELSSELSVSENTVKTHLSHLYDKLGVGRRTEALAAARRKGLLDR